jgi:hypothetical protein
MVIKKMLNAKLLLILMILIVSLPLFCLNDQDKPGTNGNPYLVPEAASAMKIDGALNEDAWGKARILELNFEVSPRENVTPPVRTEVLLTYDKSNLYIGFRCYDPDSSQIRAHLSDRDSLGGDDWVAVEIDTYNDSRRAFTLFSTPLGVQTDGISDAAGIKDYNWDMIYDSAGKIFDWGYAVEMAIPFSSLRFQRTKEDQVWGINIVRGYPRNVRYQIWAQPYDRGNTCRVCQYTKIKGFKDVSPGRNIEINPTLTGFKTDERKDFPQGGFTNQAGKAEAGLTARWGITPNLVLSGTLNPDFSQVEADSAQLDINQPFALFYEERRPFFTEGLDFFKTPLNVMYTRTMRNPQWGVKLSGKEGAYAMGAYVVRDDVTNLIFPGSQYSASFSKMQPNTSTVFRFGRDFRNNSTIGLLFTNREGGDYFNRVYGIDGNLRFSQNDEVVFQFLGSGTKYDETTAVNYGQPMGQFSDRAISATYRHKTRFHQVDLGYEDIGEDFRADMGFLPQVGLRRFNASSNYEWRTKKSKNWWTKFNLVNSARYTSGSEGIMLEKTLTNSFSYNGLYQTYVSVGNTLSRQLYNEVEFELSQFNISAGIMPTGNFSLDIYSLFGDSIDYVNSRKGSRVLLYSMLTYRIGAHLRLNVDHTFEEMNAAGDRLYTANISQAAVVYHFNARTFFRTMLQYYDYDYNVSNYVNSVEPEFKHFFTQLLFSYKINPRTVLFLGYTDNYFGGYEYGITKQDYTVFLKIGYAWVL